MKNNGERIKMIISQFCKSKADFARKVGESPQTVNNWVSRDNGMNVLNKVIEAFPEVNSDWLMTGHGTIVNGDYNINNGNLSDSIIGNSNSIDNSKNTMNNSGNTVNVTMPESGTQKNIKSTGEVEIQRLDPSDKSNSGELDRLQQRIQDLERIISEKDATIKSKDDLICVLKDMLNRQ